MSMRLAFLPFIVFAVFDRVIRFTKQYPECSGRSFRPPTDKDLLIPTGSAVRWMVTPWAA